MMDATVDSLQVAEAGRKGVWLGRLLEEEETNKTALIINATKASDSEILRNTFSSYGSALLIVFLLFCFLRLRYPRVYNLRNWIPERRSDLAKRQYGFFSWFWKLYQIPDEQICDECGMDAVCFVRLCSMGLKLCGMGMVSALWLMPLYRTATLAEETNGINDEIVMLTTANLSSGSNRFLATVFSAYCIFGFTIYLILTEFRWFTAMRHRFLMKPMARSYAVYVRNIAPAYQTNLGIKIFFEKCLPGVEVLESHICMKTSGIQKEVAKREATVLKLEHAVAEEEEYGVTPKHRADKSGVLIPGLYGIGKEVNSIDYYAAELCKQNEDINARTSKIRKIASQELPYILESDNESTKNLSYDDGEGLFSFVRANTIDVAKAVADNAAAVTTGATDLVAKAATDAAKLVLSNEDGEIYSAGFVVFKKLSTTHAALQMIHHEKPYSMEVLAAPAPEDILWSNVGRQHKDLQLGKLVSTAATIVACLLWTIPVSFVSSLSSVEGLRKEISFIDQMLDAMPSLEPIFELLAPQFLVILNALLPVILEIFTKFEGPISGAMVEASLFGKTTAIFNVTS